MKEEIISCDWSQWFQILFFKSEKKNHKKKPQTQENPQI